MKKIMEKDWSVSSNLWGANNGKRGFGALLSLILTKSLLHMKFSIDFLTTSDYTCLIPVL